MTNYLFLDELFRSVLSKSKAIEGRFYTTPKFGIELNTDTIGEMLTEALLNSDPKKKFPLVLMMPPRSSADIKLKEGGWEEFILTTFWLKTSFYGPGANLNPATQTSQHTLEQDWHDMKRAAVNFIRVLKMVTRKPEFSSVFHLVNSTPQQFTPVSSIGHDRASGVQMNFRVELFDGCTLEDYEPDDIADISLPALDSHPEHQL
jgi:hypothetical protein